MNTLEEALARLRSMAMRPLPPKPPKRDPNYEVIAAQIDLAAQYQADLGVVLAEFDRLRKGN